MTEDPVSDLANAADAAKAAETDQELIRRARGGDPQAFDALVRRHQQIVFAVALRMLGDRGEAEDVAQDAFVRAYGGLAGFRGEAKFSTWMVSITMNLARNRRRWWARRRRVITASLDEPGEPGAAGTGHDAPDPSPGPRARSEQREREQVITAALQKLPDGERMVIILRDIQGHSYEEIAGMLGCRLGTVKSRLNRARLQLRMILLDGRR